jgi:diazepam-binding inhibitor (GABA receptor modulating acyl-CoA-binding protein)
MTISGSDAQDDHIECVEDAFEGAVVFVQTSRPGNAQIPQDTMLKLYGLYKQATEGDVNIPAPGIFSLDMKAKSKWCIIRS